MKLFILIISTVLSVSAQQKWQKLNGPVGANVTFLVAKGDTLLMASGHKGTIYYSLNGGENWTQSNIRIARPFIDCIAAGDGAFIAAANEYGIYKSFDLMNWMQVYYTGKEFWSVGSDLDGNLYAGTNHTEIYISTDFGATWNLEYDGYPSGRVNNFHLSDSILWAGAYNRVLFKSFKSTPLVWDSCQGIPIFGQGYAIFSDDAGNIYAYSNGRIIRTTDKGESWLELDTNRFFQGNYIYSMLFNGRMIAGCGDETGWFGDGWGIALSDDGGLTWRWHNNGLPPKIWIVGELSNSGNITYAGTSRAGVFKSTDFGESWTPINNGLTAAHTMDIYFDDEGTIYSANWSNGFQKSTDNGESWQVINNGLTNSYCYSIIADKNGILLGGTDQGTFRSTDKGDNWEQITAPGNDYVFYFKKDKSNRIYALTYGTGVYRTTDLGNSWVKLDNGWLSGYAFGFAVDSSGSLYFGTRRGAIYKSTNDGQNWTEVYRSSNTSANVTSMAVSPNGDIFATSSYEGILRSTDNGLTWGVKNNGIDYYRSGGIAITTSGEIFASFSESNANYARRKIYYSSDNGEMWENYTFGMDLIGINTVVLDKNDNVYLATDESVWKYNPDTTTAVSDNYITVSEYKLYQNYPNPFNPSTKISYSLKEEGYVKLLIYDIKGELISTLVNEKQQSGSYEVDFTLPGNISTGVYIYRLTVSDKSSHNVIFSDVKKMVYLK